MYKIFYILKFIKTFYKSISLGFLLRKIYKNNHFKARQRKINQINYPFQNLIINDGNINTIMIILI